MVVVAGIVDILTNPATHTKSIKQCQGQWLTFDHEECGYRVPHTASAGPLRMELTSDLRKLVRDIQENADPPRVPGKTGRDSAERIWPHNQLRATNK